jgi:hypothetical protein
MTNKTATDWNENSNSQIRIAYAGLELKDLIANDLTNYFRIHFNELYNDLEEYLGDQSILTIPDIILVEVDKDEECFALVERLGKTF